MLKKTITCIDFDGVEYTEDFYFNLTKAEVIELELSEKGGLDKTIEKIVKEKDGKEIIKIFKDLIAKSYGEKSLDGRRFMKSEEILKNFTETQAYSELFTELGTDADAAAAFFKGIVPKDPKDNPPPIPK